MFYASSNLKKQHISNLISVYKRFGKNIVSIQNILKTINRNERSKMCTWYKKKKGFWANSWCSKRTWLMYRWRVAGGTRFSPDFASQLECPTLHGFKKKRRERSVKVKREKKEGEKKRGGRRNIERQSQDRSRKFIDRDAICLAARENKKL